MFTTIKIGDKDVNLLCTAATRIYYRQVFAEDLYVLLVDKAGSVEASLYLDTAEKLAYIMARQAEKGDMTKLSVTDYIAWLDQFGSVDLANVADKIYAIYNDDQRSLSIPKKKAEQQKEG